MNFSLSSIWLFIFKSFCDDEGDEEEHDNDKDDADFNLLIFLITQLCSI